VLVADKKQDKWADKASRMTIDVPALTPNIFEAVTKRTNIHHAPLNSLVYWDVYGSHLHVLFICINFCNACWKRNVWWQSFTRIRVCAFFFKTATNKMKKKHQLILDAKIAAVRWVMEPVATVYQVHDYHGEGIVLHLAGQLKILNPLMYDSSGKIQANWVNDLQQVSMTLTSKVSSFQKCPVQPLF